MASAAALVRHKQTPFRHFELVDIQTPWRPHISFLGFDQWIKTPISQDPDNLSLHATVCKRKWQMEGGQEGHWEKGSLSATGLIFPKREIYWMGFRYKHRRMYSLDESLSGELVTPSPTESFHVGGKKKNPPKNINALGLRVQKEKLLCHFE